MPWRKLSIYFTAEGPASENFFINVAVEDRVARRDAAQCFARLRCGVTARPLVIHRLPHSVAQRFPLDLQTTAFENWSAIALGFEPQLVRRYFSGVAGECLKGTFICDDNARGEVDGMLLRVNATLTAVLRFERVETAKETTAKFLTSKVWQGGDLRSVIGDSVSQRFGVDRRTLLHIAAKRHHVAAVELLLQRGAEVDSNTNGGLTPLMFACRSLPHRVGGLAMQLRTIATLLRAGADPAIRSASIRLASGHNKRGKESAFTLVVNENVAVGRGHDEVMYLLYAAAPQECACNLWETVLDRHLATYVPTGATALVGAGLCRNAAYGQVQKPPAVFSTLVALSGGPATFYDACCSSMCYRRNPNVEAQLPPDCSDELLESQGRFTDEALEIIRTADVSSDRARSVNASCTHLGASLQSYWATPRPTCTALGMQRPGVYEFVV